LLHRKKLMEAVMRGLARVLGEDEDLRGLVGLLHDIDYEYVGRNPLKHGLGALELLKGVLPEYALEAIAMHNERNGFVSSSEAAARMSRAQSFRPSLRPYRGHGSGDAW